ncbi:MAG: MscS family membrane protein [Patiriisocius sp.]|jgi:MscS family membrane protein
MRKSLLLIFGICSIICFNTNSSAGVLFQVDFIPGLQTEKTESNPDTSLTNNIAIDEAISEVLDTPRQLLKKFNFRNVFWSITILFLSYFFLKLMAFILSSLAERSARYRIRLKGITPIINILIWTMAIYLIIAGVFRPEASTIIAAAASIGLAVGFASQDILKNIFAGIVILFDRPFQVGDKIEVDNYYGEVTQIGLRSTRIVTPDDSMVTVPNADCMTKSVSNANSGEPNCQVVAEIYLPMDIDTIKTRQIAMEAAQTSKYIFLNKPITVLFFNEVKEQRIYMKMRLKAYVSDIRNEFKFKSDMTEIVIRGLVDEGLLKENDMGN